MEFVYVGPVMGKPRMTQRDVWLSPPRPAVGRYRVMSDQLKLKATQDGFVLGASAKIIIGIKMSKSWSKKKKNEKRGTFHQQKPDIDNVVKSILDILCKEDSYVYKLDVIKYWSDESIIIIENTYGNQESIDFGHYIENHKR